MGKLFEPEDGNIKLNKFVEQEKLDFKINELQSKIGEMNREIVQLRDTKVKLWEQK